MRRLLGPLLAMIVSVAASALLLEVGVRTFIGEQVKFPRHVVGADFGVRTNEPNAHYRHRSPEVEVWFEINERGLRAPRNYPYEKPEGTYRIVSLGDSFTAGYEVDFEQTFSQVLERELRASGVEVEVLNAGVSGYSNAEALLYLERELLKYDPDLVLLSFYGNDLADNLRSGLFALRDGELVQTADAYVPAGRLGNFLNTNPIFNWLSGYSDAFALAKEASTRIVKRRTVQENIDIVAAAEGGAELSQGAEGGRIDDGKGITAGGPAASANPRVDYQRRLAAAILERMYQVTRRHGIPLVIQSIPSRQRNPERLYEVFPLEYFDVERDQLLFFAAKPVLDPWIDRELLYHLRSHGHWTPRAHEVAGRELARVILEAAWPATDSSAMAREP